MATELEKVVPFGRSMDEYRKMFALTDGDLDRKILGVADGPASFNAEMLVENSYISLENVQLHVTISIGATIVQNDDTMETLLKRADTLLYKSKNTGRNRLTMG